MDIITQVFTLKKYLIYMLQLLKKVMLTRFREYAEINYIKVYLKLKIVLGTFYMVGFRFLFLQN